MKPNFETRKEGDKLRDTKTGEVFQVSDIDREQETCAIWAMRIKGGAYASVKISEQVWKRLEVVQ